MTNTREESEMEKRIEEMAEEYAESDEHIKDYSLEYGYGSALYKGFKAGARAMLMEIEHLKEQVSDCAALYETALVQRSELISLKAELAKAKEEGKKDYDGMREFQFKYIQADHDLSAAMESLNRKITECAKANKRIKEQDKLIAKADSIFCMNGFTEFQGVEDTHIEWYQAKKESGLFE